MIRLLFVCLFASLLACSAFVAVKVPFLLVGPPRHLPTAEILYHWRGLFFGSHVITAQLPVLWLTGALLGPRRGGLTVALYLALGLGGLPIFTDGGGFGYFAQPTFGYLVAFLPAVILVGATSDQPRFGRVWAGMLWSLALVEAIGLVYDLVARGLVTTGAAWQQFGLVRLTSLPGELAMLTTIAFLVAMGRKLASWWADRGADRVDETQPPLLPPEAYATAATEALE